MQITIRRDGETYGPYTLAEVRSYLGDGRLVPKDEAWLEGESSGRPLADLLADLAKRSDGIHAPPPPSGVGDAVADVPRTSAIGRAPHYAPGGLGDRFIALIVDGIIGFLFLIPAVAALVMVGVEDFGAGTGVVFIAGMIGAIGYGFVKDGMKGGQSIGKRMTGLMVVHLPTNQPCSTGQSALRALVYLLLNFVPYLGWLVEPIMVFAASDRRRLGDRAADTMVITADEYRP
jgi:uncharacterized RDD family membrane protein YckC